MAVTDASGGGSSDEGFHEDMQKFWPPFGAEELDRLMNTSHTRNMYISVPFQIPLVYHLF